MEICGTHFVAKSAREPTTRIRRIPILRPAASEPRSRLIRNAPCGCDPAAPHLLSTMHYTYRERHGEEIYRFKSVPSRRRGRHIPERLLPPQCRLELPGGRHRHRLRDVIGPDNMMWDNMMWGSSRPFPNRARSLRRSWPGCRTTNRPSQPRTTIQGSPAEHRPRVQFRRGEADPPRLKSQPLCGSTSSPRPRCSRRPRASGPGSTWRRPWPS
jgi:hypothetical protein